MPIWLAGMTTTVVEADGNHGILRIPMKLQLQLKLECPVCKQNRGNNSDEDAAAIALFGYTGFAVCPCCHKQVHELRHDRGYQRRAIRYAHKQLRGA